MEDVSMGAIEDEVWNDYVDRYSNYLRHYDSTLPPSAPMTRTQYLAYVAEPEVQDRFW